MSNATEPTKPKYFNCYLDNETIVNYLSDEQAGKLWKMLFAYSNWNEMQDISDRIVSMAFDVMAQQIDRDFEKYRKKCETNRANRAKATQRKQPTTIENERQRPSTTVNVGDQYKEKDKDKSKLISKDINLRQKVSSAGLPCGQPAPKPEFCEVLEFYKNQSGQDDAYFCDEFMLKMESDKCDWENWQDKLIAYAVKAGRLNCPPSKNNRFFL